MFEWIMVFIAVVCLVVVAVNFHSITKLWELYFDMDMKKFDEHLRMQDYVRSLEDRIKKMEDNDGKEEK